MAAYGGSGGGGGGPQDFGSSQSGNKINVTLVFTCNVFFFPSNLDYSESGGGYQGGRGGGGGSFDSKYNLKMKITTTWC